MEFFDEVEFGVGEVVHYSPDVSLTTKRKRFDRKGGGSLGEDDKTEAIRQRR